MNTIDYLGRPWQRGTFDCWSLVREVYARELGIDLPLVLTDPGNIKEVFSEFANSEIFGLFEQVDSPRNYDIVGMYFETTRRLGHVGVYLEETRGVLHCPCGRPTVVQSLALFYRFELVQGFYRYRG